MLQLHNCDFADVLPNVPRHAAVITDPPYGMGYRSGKNRGLVDNDTLDGGRRRSVDWQPITGDFAPFDPAPLLGFERVVLWGANWYASRLPDSGRWLAWDKREETGPDDGSDFELAWTNLRGKTARMHRQLWRGVCKRQVEQSERAALHPNMKPLALMNWCLDMAAVKPGDVLFDPFAGSAPLAVCCLRRGVGYIGCEIDPKFYATARKRIDAELESMFG